MNGVRGGRAPVEQPQREAEIGLDHEVAVGRGGVGDRAHVDDGVELAAIEPARTGRPGGTTSASWRLREIAPLAVGAEHVVDHDVGRGRPR